MASRLLSEIRRDIKSVQQGISEAVSETDPAKYTRCSNRLAVLQIELANAETSRAEETAHTSLYF